jgi:hypothetical protein
MLDAFISRAKRAIDLNKNGKIDLWEIAVLFLAAFVVALVIELLF